VFVILSEAKDLCSLPAAHEQPAITQILRIARTAVLRD
jgi:hypothetical protein